jgi:hypothetical protein
MGTTFAGAAGTASTGAAPGAARAASPELRVLGFKLRDPRAQRRLRGRVGDLVPIAHLQDHFEQGFPRIGPVRHRLGRGLRQELRQVIDRTDQSCEVGRAASENGLAGMVDDHAQGRDHIDPEPVGRTQAHRIIAEAQ